MTLSFSLVGTVLLIGTVCAFGVSAANSNPYPEPPNLPAIRARYPMDTGAEAMLSRNGFVVLNGIAREDLSTAYPHHGHDLNIFVTTDAMLQVWYALHRRLIMDGEQNDFAPQLEHALPELMAANESLRKQTPDTAAQAALRRNAVTLAVACCLLEPQASTPPDIRPEVEALLAKIRAHTDHAPYPAEDYTQYTVRGHYADTPTLSRYFLASLWLSRRFLSVDPAPGADPDAPLREAVALAAVLRASPNAQAQFRQLNGARRALTGSPNAISAEQLLDALNVSRGKAWALPQSLHADSLAKLRRELALPAYPVTTVWTKTTWPDTPFPSRIIALLPDLALPDSRLFQKTVNPAIPNRSLPSGLEVAAALGFEAARRQIQATDPQGKAVLSVLDDHPLLSEQDDFGVYPGWLRLLATLAKPDHRAPEFMQGEPWQFEKINTTLASWAQLRHTYVLYGAQTYAQTLGIEMPSPTALVEPNPLFYQALTGLAEQTSAALTASHALAPKDADLLRALARQCKNYQTFAEAELAGTLTPAQADNIEGFGDWLEQFEFKSGPLVADVATGIHGEVLHVATGDFHPLIVIPDRKTGTAYVGWTLSYYEFVKPGQERMTDARWQTLQRSPYLRPDRPDWSREFAASESGPQWQSRAPLRQAERLFQAGKPDAALALLRQTVASSPDTTQATECQFRIGEYLLDNHQEAAARAELLKCRRLPGCDAYDRARWAIGQMSWQDNREQRSQKQQKQEQQQGILANALLHLLSQETSPAARLKDEKQLAVILTKPSWDPERLRQGAEACRTPAIRDALGYLALAAEQNATRFEETAASRQALLPHTLTFSQKAVSPSLRAAALAMAVAAGYHADDPRESARLLTPFLKATVFQATDPALTFLHQITGEERLDAESDPKWVFSFAVDRLRETLIETSYYAGRFDDMTAYARDLPHESGNGTMEEMFQRYQAYPDFARQPLRLFAGAEKLEQEENYPAAAETFSQIYTQFPTSKIALEALWRAEDAFRSAGDPARADGIIARYVQQFPDSSVALLERAEKALDSGNFALAQDLLARSRAAEAAHPTFFQERLNYGSGQSLEYNIKQEQALREGLKPLALAAGKPEMLQRELRKADPVALSEELAEKLPGRREDILWTLLTLYPYSGLSAHILQEFPDSPRSVRLWPAENEYHSPPNDAPPPVVARFPDSLVWLVPLVNRGPAYVYAAQAQSLFSRTLHMREDEEENPETLNLVVEQARFVRGAYPATRAAVLADCVAARALLDGSRPEAARDLLQTAAVPLSADDPLKRESALLAHRASREIAAKHQPDWLPLWTAEVGQAGSLLFPNDPPVTAPLLTEGLLVVPIATEKQWSGLAALDANTGKKKWTAPVGHVMGMTMDGKGILYCATEDGQFITLDSRTGRTLSRKPIDASRSKSNRGIGAESDTAVALAGGALLLAQQGSFIAGYSLATQAELWKIKTWWPARIYQKSLQPAIIGQTVFWAGSDAKVHAFDALTGQDIWTQSYPADRNWEIPLTDQPIALDNRHLLILLRDRLEVRDPQDGHLYQSASRAAFPSFPNEMAASKAWGMEWDSNGYSGFWNLSTLTQLPFSLPRLSSMTQPAFDGPRVYVQGDYTNEILVMDMETGARLNWLPISDAFAGWVTLGKGKGYLTSTNGRVIAFPLLPAPQP